MTGEEFIEKLESDRIRQEKEERSERAYREEMARCDREYGLDPEIDDLFKPRRAEAGRWNRIPPEEAGESDDQLDALSGSSWGEAGKEGSYRDQFHMALVTEAKEIVKWISLMVSVGMICICICHVSGAKSFSVGAKAVLSGIGNAWQGFVKEVNRDW